MSRHAPYGGKRSVDLFIVALLAAPAALLTGAVAMAVRLDDRGPLFFRQERVGRDGITFRVLKFRTMHAVPDNPLFPDRTAFTRVGCVLRRTSLDEVPQLWNVLLGEMSVVGPRPTLPYQVQRYTSEQRRRHAVRPGLTGLAQVSGRNAMPWGQRIELDLQYVDHQSPLGDLVLIWRSFLVVLRGTGVVGHPLDDPLARLDPASPPRAHKDRPPDR